MDEKDYFVYDGKVIYYSISFGKEPIKMVNHKEKMSLFLTFYNSQKECLGTISVYDDRELLSPLSVNYLQRKYENVVSDGHIKASE